VPRPGPGRVRERLAGKDDHVVKVGPALERVGSFAAFLGEAFDESLSYAALRKAESVEEFRGHNT